MMVPVKMMSAIAMLALSLTWALAVPRCAVARTRPYICPVQRECPSFSYDALYDFQNNVTTTSPYVTLLGGLTGTGCATQGVLKLALASAAVDANRRRVLIDFFFTNPTNWVFNLGDSITNDGYAGDSSTQRYDAEVQGVARVLNGYLSDVGGSGPAFHILDLFSSRLTLVVGDGYISWLPDDNNLINYYQNPGFFALNGQDDSGSPGGTNYDLYLGLNRVINGNYRSGTGLCKVGIKFLKEI
jgi:hypothetical protein